MAAVLDRYSNASELVWLQEEPEKHGCVEHGQGPLL
ncbi:MAG: hypothetical protein R2706_01660 [Acidimicrobiales bacterium]